MYLNREIFPLHLWTGTTELWMDAFENVGFKKVKPHTIKLDKEDIVSQLSSLRTEDGRDRKLVGDDLRYNNDRKVTYVHGRAASVELSPAARHNELDIEHKDYKSSTYYSCALARCVLSSCVVLI